MTEGGVTSGVAGDVSGGVTGGVVDWRDTGFWEPGEGVGDEEFAAAEHSLFDGPFTWPVLVARRDALEHNIATMAAFARRHGLALAPHGKASMAPALWRRQLDAGAWGITVATANQALVCRKAGVRRVLLANELLDGTALRGLARELDRDPAFAFLFYVDSAAGVEAASRAAGGRPFRVLVELGHAGGRTGCRTAAEAVRLARAAAAAPGVEVAGVAGYEGGLPGADEVTAYLRDLRGLAAEFHAAGVCAGGGPIVVSAGGSAWFDIVARELGGIGFDGREALPLLRSGAYVSHDDGFYRVRTPFNRIPGEGRLEPALEVWAQVLSVPEPGLAIAGLGKRDAPYDEGLPVPRRVRRDGVEWTAEGIALTRMNDHHAYLALMPGTALVPGDLVCFGVSHPCTAFDKRRAIPVVDEDHRVVDVLRTFF
ncbi:alanine racemase [Bailinhaonella thermotolerans]|uniref:Alanine racemase n=1 Tax=Bailinhaonella thermotolerans TaxID=1070861 RepID=A0A3A4BSK4_9ACTN|nr:alanine racemase [Bailinhaonella thermotolerans]RJL34296.1 alanine racemase [Bailinhaonella thermotolerans]